MSEFPSLRVDAPCSGFRLDQIAFIETALTVIGDRLEALQLGGGLSLIREATPWPDLRYWAHTLYIDGEDAMSTMPWDLLDHKPILEEFHGHVLITGSGLGVSSMFAAANPAVTSITAVELDSRVLEQIAGVLSVPGVRFIQADADTWEPDMAFDCAYLDHRAVGAVPDAVVALYRGQIATVLDWTEERERLWQTVQ